MDKVEQAARIVARAFGCGSSWHADNDAGVQRNWTPESGETTHRVRLGGLFNAETPEADISLPIRSEVRRSSDKREPSVSGVHEFKRWSGERIPWTRLYVGGVATAITPKVDTGARAMIALSGLDKPLQAILTLYATLDGKLWPSVEMYARACLRQAEHAGIAEAMFRLLKHASNRERAKLLCMRESDYVALIRPAQMHFEDCLWRAADTFLIQFDHAREIITRIDDAVR